MHEVKYMYIHVHVHIHSTIYTGEHWKRHAQWQSLRKALGALVKLGFLLLSSVLWKCACKHTHICLCTCTCMYIYVHTRLIPIEVTSTIVLPPAALNTPHHCKTFTSCPHLLYSTYSGLSSTHRRQKGC